MREIKMRSKKDVAAYFEGDKIECLLCGKLFSALSNHIIRSHGMSVDEYKEKFNLPWSSGLVSGKTRDRQAKALKQRIDKGDKTLMPIGKVAHIGQHAAKRPFRDYDIKMLGKNRKKILDQHQKNTYSKAVKILEKAEELNCPACCVCLLPEMPGFHNLYVASKKFPEIKTRYEDLKRKVPRGVELITEQSRSEVKKQIIELHSNGMSTREIAKELYLGKTTVKRALRNEGAFKDC